MFSIVLRFAVTVAAIPLCATYYPGVHMQDLQAALIAGAALGAFYALLRPLARLLIKDRQLPDAGADLHPDRHLAGMDGRGDVPRCDDPWTASGGRRAVAVSVNVARMVIDIITRSMKK